ncbi:DUF2391 family protein [Candidatus Dojkabacteria bacterium]|uniref:DUF2391 family protein n=1 Tax=Candidatus Dojkabacteria bacterium TaxID=2099670 RepID=A0A955L910_9BACT|nr:DUF2391 family protein [Candidatus Dojkabacteria bacterium]
MKNKELQSHKQTVRINGALKEMVTIIDDEGKIFHKFMMPHVSEFYLRDVLQVIIGSVLLAIPMTFSEELWIIAGELTTYEITMFVVVSVFFNGLFIYQNFYKGKLKRHIGECIKRVIFTYLFALLIATFFLSLIHQLPWDADPWTALARVVLVALPASLSGTLADSIK